jgi:hypothetical protein
VVPALFTLSFPDSRLLSPDFFQHAPFPRRVPGIKPVGRSKDFTGVDISTACIRFGIWKQSEKLKVYRMRNGWPPVEVFVCKCLDQYKFIKYRESNCLQDGAGGISVAGVSVMCGGIGIEYAAWKRKTPSPSGSVPPATGVAASVFPFFGARLPPGGAFFSTVAACVATTGFTAKTIAMTIVSERPTIVAARGGRGEESAAVRGQVFFRPGSALSRARSDQTALQR